MCDGNVHWRIESLEHCHKVQTLWHIKVAGLINLKVDLCDDWSTKVVSIQNVITSAVVVVPISCLQCKLSSLLRIPVVE